MRRWGLFLAFPLLVILACLLVDVILPRRLSSSGFDFVFLTRRKAQKRSCHAVLKERIPVEPPPCIPLQGLNGTAPFPVVNGSRGGSVLCVQRGAAGVAIEPIDIRSFVHIRAEEQKLRLRTLPKAADSAARRSHLYVNIERVVKRSLIPLYSMIFWREAQNLSRCRKVFVDLGCRFYRSSVRDFERRYPCSELFEVHAFDVRNTSRSFPRNIRDRFRNFTFYQEAVWTHGRGVPITDGQMASISLTNEMTAALFPSVDIAELLSTRLALTAEDFVVVKMDVELAEWQLVPHLASRGSLGLIDEMYLECHWKGMSAATARSQPCVDMINELRLRGVYAHRWV
jgi:hypothetical protein